MSASVTCSSTSRRLARERDPHLGQPLGRAAVVELVGTDALDRGQGPFDGPQHVGDGDVVGGPGELVAAVGAAAGADDPGPAELGEDVLEEVLRNPLRPGQELTLDRFARFLGRRELDRRPYRVVRLRRDAHGGDSYQSSPPGGPGLLTSTSDQGGPHRPGRLDAGGSLLYLSTALVELLHRRTS